MRTFFPGIVPVHPIIGYKKNSPPLRGGVFATHFRQCFSLSYILSSKLVCYIYISLLLQGLQAGEMTLAIMHVLKRHAGGDTALLHAELMDLCGAGLVAIVGVILGSKEALLTEFQVGFFK